MPRIINMKNWNTMIPIITQYMFFDTQRKFAITGFLQSKMSVSFEFALSVVNLCSVILPMKIPV